MNHSNRKRNRNSKLHWSRPTRSSLQINDQQPNNRNWNTGEAVPRARESSTHDKLNLQASDLHPDLLAKICRLYHIDHLLLHALGMEDPICPPAQEQL
jgi:hypothetical protein